MATPESGVLSNPSLKIVSKLDFQGFESENSPGNDGVNSGDVELSEFIRNLPGLPSSNPLLIRNNNDVVSCDAASGPLEDSSELSCAVKTDLCDLPPNKQELTLASSARSEHSNSERVEDKPRDRHSRHRSSRDCRRCHERRKTKRCNVGVQCKIDRHLGRSGALQPSIPRSLYTSSAVPHWENYKYATLIKLETYPNGNACVLHMCQDEINHLNLNDREMRELADEFLKVCYSYL